MSRHGHRLQKPDPSGIFVCPESGYRYQEIKSGLLRCLDLDEQSVLPEDKSVGQKRYREFKDD
jgi:UDP-2-acetamido-3-amino-2,3-dideoxy-glucuronate N-acetyltransferase